MEREGKADRSDSEHLHDLDGGNASAIPERVTAELGARVAEDIRDGDLVEVDGGVDGVGDGVAEAIDDAAKEVEADKDVSYIFLHVWLVRKCRKPETSETLRGRFFFFFWKGRVEFGCIVFWLNGVQWVFS